MFLPRRGEGVLLCNLSALFGTNRSLNRSPRPRWLCHRPQRPLLSSGQNHYFCFHSDNVFSFLSVSENLTSGSFQTIFSSWFFAAFYLQCKLQLLTPPGGTPGDGDLPTLNFFSEVICRFYQSSTSFRCFSLGVIGGDRNHRFVVVWRQN